MFTGLIKELGVVINITKTKEKYSLCVKNSTIFPSTKVNNSISVNGCCLTVVNVVNDIATFDILPETLRCTNLNLLKVGQSVNLEDSLTLESKLGGHVVQGHVDCTAIISDIEQDGASTIFSFTLDKNFLDMLVPKAFICIDGISLTIMKVNPGEKFSVMVIPHTQLLTTAHTWKKGTVVNIEVDIINKSVFHYLKILNNFNK